jgi:hypothetical protein
LFNTGPDIGLFNLDRSLYRPSAIMRFGTCDGLFESTFETLRPGDICWPTHPTWQASIL